MQRRSNRSAILEEKRKSNLRWSGRVEDRDRDRELAERIRSSQEHSVSDQGSPSISECLAAGSADGSQLQREISATRGDPQGAEDSAEKAAGNGRLVPLGAHHEGSFRVYMSHKMEKLRNQVGGGVSLRAGIKLSFCNKVPCTTDCTAAPGTCCTAVELYEFLIDKRCPVALTIKKSLQ